MKQLVRFCVAALLFILVSTGLRAQEYMPPVLPKFSAVIKTGKIQLEWISGFKGIQQIGIQRSLDSVINFSTVGYASSPAAIRNAYLDNKPLPGRNFYRLFILFGNGKYMYSDVQEALPDSTIRGDAKLTAQEIREISKDENGSKEPERIPWKPSNYIYTTADGNVNIKLPDAPKQRFRVRFYEQTGEFLFEIKEIKEPFLILEKGIFLHSGWFKFEIFKGSSLMERWNFFIPLNYRS
ncbi:hypothetical protein COR50_10910 [Chitinophaga caeni]|uniref:Uncharacterized protein n=1 Tax=Chitinophaga caeni TaxID=2029983 RepID=A0A291QUT7_9BACT|nr:hypothetical protein [Chitinophaga caeni]ATL47633.1 hypothetical protein COR50_10910 [Chitinophaga caeni]